MVNFLVNLINTLIRSLGLVLSFIISVLPNSPFQSVISSTSDVSAFLGGLAWIIPIGTIVSIFSTWVTCISLYYLYSIIMRWIKMID